MKSSSRSALLGLSWVAALAAGLLIGRASPSPPSTPSPQAAPASPLSKHRANALDAPSYVREQRTPGSGSAGSSLDAETHHRSMIELSDILNIGNRLERTRMMLDFIDRLGNDQMTTVIDSFQDAGWVDYNRSEFSMLITAWMDRDPFAAIAHLSENDADGWTRKTAVSAWAAENPEAAAAAIEGLEDGGKVNDWVVGLIEGMARNDPSSALAALADLPGSPTKNQAIREILPEVVIRGAEYAGKWIEQIDEPQLQRETAKRLAHSLARRDPESASEWIRGMTTVETRRDASEVVSEIYAQQDLEGAMTWVESLPENTMTEAAEGVARHLTRRDPTEAAQWLQTLGDSPDLDGARINFLREASQRDPQTALENVALLSRPQDQERYYRDILSRWRKTDQAAAIEWAQANSESLSPHLLSSILPK